MKVTPQTYWSVPAYLPYLQPKLTEKVIRDAEAKIGFKLPSEYLALLEVQNGGGIRYSLPDTVHYTLSGIGPYYPSITKFDWEEAQEEVSFKLDGLVPFDGDGHYHLCLDYRKNNDLPCITMADIECDRESKIAGSFAEYLDMLVLEISEDDFVIPSVSDIEELKSQLAKVLKRQFEPTDFFAHGYAIERLQCGSASDPQWISLSPNLVPRGFVREEDKRYQELRDLLPGEARRYPELSDASYTVYLGKGIRSKALEAFRGIGFNLEPLRQALTAI
jgi:hypothetical protein